MITRSSLTITAALLAALLAAFSLNAAAEVCVTDDRDREVCLDQPAERIIALSPGATELAWAAGAGDAVVGVVSYSDYPEAAKSVPSVGSHTRVDMEKLLSLKPDLILAWATGNPKEQTDRLQELDQTLYFTEPGTLSPSPPIWSASRPCQEPKRRVKPGRNPFAPASKTCASATVMPPRCRCSTRSGMSR